MPNLENLKLEEAARRLKLLGETIKKSEYEYSAICDRAQEVRMPVKVLVAWWRKYATHGLEGLKPNWDDISDYQITLALKRRDQLGNNIDNVTLSADEIDGIAKSNHWSWRQTNRWLERYRVKGLFGLLPGQGQRTPPKKVPLPRDLGTLDEESLAIIYKRFAIIEPLIQTAKVSQLDVEKRLKETDVSTRTIWNYLKAYRTNGLAGLAPVERSDKGKLHNISERMMEIIRGIYLSQPDLPAIEVHKRACERARILGEIEPSISQVRRIIRSIPASIRLLSHGRDKQYKDGFRFTHRYDFAHMGIIFQIDNTRVDLLIKDMRDAKYRAISGETRPWLTTVMESSSRSVLSSVFGYDQPDQFVVASAIRQAILHDEMKEMGGIPSEIWVDNGKDFVSHHVRELTRELGITLNILPPHQPQKKGIIERFFRVLNTRLWCTLPGYVGSNVVERNPSAKASLNLHELVQVYWQFVEKYHNETHSELGKSPLDYWRDNCFAPSIDPRRLDVLLQVKDKRRVIKTGIKYGGREYWHQNLALLVGQDVILRVDPVYGAPDTIEVYHNASWICTAYATDTDSYHSIPAEVIAAAQKEQLMFGREQIAEARSFLKKVDGEIQKLRIVAPDEPKTPNPKKNNRSVKKYRKPDFLDMPSKDE